MPGSSCIVVEEAKDLNPLRVRLFRYNAAPSPTVTAPPRLLGANTGGAGALASARIVSDTSPGEGSPPSLR